MAGKEWYFTWTLQWSVTGDTFPLGCRFSDHIVFGRESFTDSDDCKDSVYRSVTSVGSTRCYVYLLGLLCLQCCCCFSLGSVYQR